MGAGMRMTYGSRPTWARSIKKVVSVAVYCTSSQDLS